MTQSMTAYVDALARRETQLATLYRAVERLIGTDPHAEDACASLAVAVDAVARARVSVTRYLRAIEQRTREATP